MATFTNTSTYAGTSKVSMENGEIVSIATIWPSVLVASTRILQLRNMLHVPTVCKNLLLVGQFAKDHGVYFKFYPFLCFVKDIQTGKTLLVVHMHDGLYRFDVSCTTSN